MVAKGEAKGLYTSPTDQLLKQIKHKETRIEQLNLGGGIYLTLQRILPTAVLY